MQTPMLGRVLVVDDEGGLLKALCEVLLAQGYEACGFASGREALVALETQEFDLLLTDLMMPEMDGMALLRAGLEIDPYLVGVLMTGQGTIQTAVEAMKLGAFDYLPKPFKMSILLPVVSRAIEARRLRLENLHLRETVAIYELSQTVAFSLDLNALLNKVVDAALQQCRADEASLLLPVTESDEFYVAVTRGAPREHILGQRVKLGQGIAGWVAHHHQPVILHGQVDDPRFVPYNPRAEIYSSISVPMLVGGELVGILNVNATRQRRPFTLGQVKALSLLLSTGASALKSAQLYDQTCRAEERYRSIYEGAMEGIFQTTPAGRFLSANPAQARMLGYDSPAELVGAIESIDRQLYVASARRAELRQELEEKGVVQGFEVQLYR